MRPARPRFRVPPDACLAPLRLQGCVPAAVAALTLVGCAAPEVRLQSAANELVPKGDRPEALVFHADIATRGLGGRQLVLEVTLLDRDGRPLKSRDGRYENRLGYVAAGRTVMIWSDAETVVRERVTLPLAQVPMPNGHWPTLARYRIYDSQRRMLAEARRRLVEPPADFAATRLSGRMPGRAPSRKPATTQPVSGAKWIALIRQIGSGTARLVEAIRPNGADDAAPAPRLPGSDRITHRVHIVLPGDTLASIAAMYLGDSSRWHEVYDLNDDRLISPDLLLVGQALIIPNDSAAELQ